MRNQDLYAFVEIPRSTVDVDIESLIKDPGTLPVVDFHSEDSNFSDARQWFSVVISETVKAERLSADGVNFERIKKLSVPTPVRGLGLLEKNASGEIQPGKEKDRFDRDSVTYGRHDDDVHGDLHGCPTHAGKRAGGKIATDRGSTAGQRNPSS